MHNNVSVLMPVYNEAGTIEKICSAVLKLPYVKELIIVDDASTDESSRLIAAMTDPRIKLLRNDSNRGKTLSLATAIGRATGDILVVQDADLEYDPAEIQYLCQPIWDDLADVVYGSRFLVRGASRVLYFYHYVGNRFITFVSNLFTNKNMSDVETCYKAFRRCVVQGMPIVSRRFGFEVEVTAKVCKTRARIYETPISYHGRTYEQGKKITYRDGLYALWYIVRYNLDGSAQMRDYVARVNRDLAARLEAIS